ncbi:fungal-specific transcription factor domain-containing protein [Phlebopus sp. FC_14]|nr:fungal-specific transcription factor domain-containing protein [Phlebopus sp. FC_14]
MSCAILCGERDRCQTFLDTLWDFSCSILRNPEFGRARRSLLRCSETLWFIIKVAIWFDVMAAVTLTRSPKSLDTIRDLFGHEISLHDEATVPLEVYSMLPIVGCENDVVLALAEIAHLAHWKDVHTAAGNLDIVELVMRGQGIEETLKKPSSFIPEHSSTSFEKQAHTRYLTSEVLRASAHVYLQSVISGDYPRCQPIIKAVDETLTCLKAVHESHTRSVIFGLYICGCLTDDAGHRTYILERLIKHQAGPSGNIGALIEDSWRQRNGGPVDWRGIVRDAGVLLV